MKKRADLKIGFAGFIIAAVGAGIGFAGFEIENRQLSLIGFAITATGVMIGFIGVIIGMMKHGKEAVLGSVEAAEKLQESLSKKLKSMGSDTIDRN